jgi:hypothetical protein
MIGEERRRRRRGSCCSLSPLAARLLLRVSSFSGTVRSDTVGARSSCPAR